MIKGLKSLFFSLTFFSLVYYGVVKSQIFWLKQIVIIEQLLLVFLAVIIVFASYFNRSRLAFLSMLWLIYYGGLSFTPPWSNWLAVHGDWLMLFGCFCILLLSMIKDRGVVSIHGFYRLVFIIMAGGVAYLWLSTNEAIIALLQSLTNIDSFKKYLLVELPIILSVVISFWRTVKRADLVTSAVFISLLVWILHHYQLINLPISLLLMLLSVHYLFVIVIDAYFLAYRDDLTALPSRRALNQLALSLGRKYTVAMLDIDHFKKFNDTYGHDIGDQVLKLVAAKIGKVKGGGKAFRYGGEEFTIVFPSKTIEQALPELEAVRQAIQDYKIVIRQPQRKTKQQRSSKKGAKNADFKTVNVTISIGVAIRADKQGFEQALKCSDQALYKAKKTGRNKVSY
ncbi:MAG: GGDEF domain-containing protein [Colwellia sp.]|nr:GGDEF domain-containing protein [Colwellia sp.]